MTSARTVPGPPAPWAPWWAVVHRPADRAALLAALGVGAAFDLAIRNGIASAGSALAVAAVAGALAATGRFSRPALLLLALMPIVGVGLAVRQSAWLVVPDVGAVVALTVGATALAGEEALRELTSIGAAVRAGALALHSLRSAGFLAQPIAAAVRERQPLPPGSTLRALGRGLVLAAPVVLVLGVLLASADAVFASVVRVRLPSAGLAEHAALIVTGALLGATLLRSTASAPPPVPGGAAWRLGTTEAATVMGLVAALYALFAAVQLVALAGGADHVLRTAGLTYAEYARSGFFQLLAAAAMTLGLLWAIGLVAGGASDRRLLVLAEVVVALTLMIVLVAVRRLHLYEAAFGLTMLRFMALVACAWLAIVLVLVGIDRAREGRPAVAPLGSVTAALGLLVMLNVANPEAIVVRRNVDALARTGRLDVDYLTSLSDDAVPAVVEQLAAVPGPRREQLRTALCISAADRPATGTGMGFSWARARAEAALHRVCPVYP